VFVKVSARQLSRRWLFVRGARNCNDPDVIRMTRIEIALSVAAINRASDVLDVRLAICIRVSGVALFLFLGDVFRRDAREKANPPSIGRPLRIACALRELCHLSWLSAA